MLSFVFQQKSTGRMAMVIAEDIHQGAEAAAMLILERGIHEITDESIADFRSIATLSHQVGGNAIKVDPGAVK